MPRKRKRSTVDVNTNTPVRACNPHDINNAIDDGGVMICPECGEDITIEWWLNNEQTDRKLRQQLVEVIRDHE